MAIVNNPCRETLNDPLTIRAKLIDYYTDISLKENQNMPLVFKFRESMMSPGALVNMYTPTLLNQINEEIPIKDWITRLLYTLSPNEVFDSIQFYEANNSFVYQVSQSPLFTEEYLKSLTESTLIEGFNVELKFQQLEVQLAQGDIVIDPATDLSFSFSILVNVLSLMHYNVIKALTPIVKSRNIYTCAVTGDTYLNDQHIIFYDDGTGLDTFITKDAGGLFYVLVQNNNDKVYWMKLADTEAGSGYSISPLSDYSDLKDNTLYLMFDDVQYSMDITGFDYDDIKFAGYVLTEPGLDPDDINWSDINV